MEHQFDKSGLCSGCGNFEQNLGNSECSGSLAEGYPQTRDLSEFSSDEEDYAQETT